MLEILIIVIVPGLLLTILAAQKRWARVCGLARGLLVSYFTIVLLLGGAEVYFRYIYAAPEGPLARDNWMARYWRTNSLGYRDREWTPAEWQGKKTILVVGDSFTAGWGVADRADRYPDVLAQNLGDAYAVINMGLGGSATQTQLKALQAYPLSRPDVVILQYFLNDIEDAALSVGQFQSPQPLPFWARESYLGNYLYFLNNGGFGDSYWAWEYAMYDNYAIWDIHRQELEDFTDYTEGIGARLIVVIFPNLQDPFHSIPYVDRVAQVFQGRGVTAVLKLFDAAEAWPVSDRIVSPRDAHPSVGFHHYVGETLYEQYFAP